MFFEVATFIKNFDAILLFVSRATLPVEKMSKIKGFTQPQSTEHVTPDKNVDSLTKLNKTITPSHVSLS